MVAKITKGGALCFWNDNRGHHEKIYPLVVLEEVTALTGQRLGPGLTIVMQKPDGKNREFHGSPPVPHPAMLKAKVKPKL